MVGFSLGADLVVGGQCMRVHDDVAHAWVFRQRYGDRWRLSVRMASLFEDLTYGGQVRCLRLEGASQRRIEDSGTVQIEQFGQAGGGGAEIRRDARPRHKRKPKHGGKRDADDQARGDDERLA